MDARRTNATGASTATESPAPSAGESGTATASDPSTSTDPSSGLSLPSPSSRHAPTDGFATVEPALLDDGVTVERVTTLAADGPGSLRAAVQRRGSEPTLVVFEVGGVVDLAGDHLFVAKSNTMIAGQTAPSPGITIVRGGVLAVGENVFVQHLRVRPGDEIPRDFGGEGGAVDAMGVTGESGNVVFDHCTATWGTDENMSTTTASGVTFSNNLIAEGLRDSIHPDGPHAMGTLVGNDASDVAVYGNVWAHNMERHPRLKDGTNSVVVNNLAHNFGDGVRIGDGPPRGARTSIVGNRFRAGPATDPSEPVVWVDADAADPRVYLEDNAVSEESMPLVGENVSPVEERPTWADSLSPLPAGDVVEHNLAAAGARPADRTPHDERVLADVREGTGSFVDSQADVGGYPDLEASERSLDVPESGIAEWLARHTRAVELPDASPP